MPALLIKDLPAEVHEWLKREAERNRRSMTQQAIVILEERMPKFRPLHFGPPLKMSKPLTDEFVKEAINEGRP